VAGFQVAGALGEALRKKRTKPTAAFPGRERLKLRVAAAHLRAYDQRHKFCKALRMAVFRLSPRKQTFGVKQQEARQPGPRASVSQG
jgi:hypothetical protein